jgi:hypothetical protein
VDDFDEVLTTAQRRHTRLAALVALVATTVIAAVVLVVLAPLDAGGAGARDDGGARAWHRGCPAAAAFAPMTVTVSRVARSGKLHT